MLLWTFVCKFLHGRVFSDLLWIFLGVQLLGFMVSSRYNFLKWSQVKWSHSVMSDCATPWTVAYQASPSMGFSRQEYWSGLIFPSPGDLPDPGIKPRFPALQADALPSEPPGKPITFWGIAKLLSKVAVSFYILTNYLWRKQFFHSLTNSCYCPIFSL